MKNAMKKIMSLVLVAMILVSAIPFGASADDAETFWIELGVDGTKGVDAKNISVASGTAITEAFVKEQAEALYPEYFNGNYTVSCYDCDGTGKAGIDGYIGAGVMFTTKTEEPDEPEMTTFWIELNVDGKNVDSKTVSLPYGTVMDEATVKLYAQNHLYGAYFGDSYTYTGCYDFGGKAGVNGYIGAGIKFTTKVAEPVAYPISIDVDGEMKALTDKISVTYNEVLSMVGLDADDIDYIVYEGDAVEGTRFFDAGDTIKLAGATRVFIFTETKTNTGSTNTGSSGTGSSSSSNNSYNANTGSTSSTATSYSKFAYPVYLNIYTDTTVGTVKKTVNITNGIAADGKVTLSEVKNLVPNYYAAIDGNVGIIYDGLYPAKGNWVLNYAVDTKYDVIEGLYEAAADNYVYINVMISNAQAYTSSTSTNPKTGDEIYMAVTGLALSACALATVYYISKKRAMV